jgi:hypothetical protein
MVLLQALATNGINSIQSRVIRWDGFCLIDVGISVGFGRISKE